MFERGDSAFYKGDFALIIFLARRIVGRFAVTGNRNVRKVVGSVGFSVEVAFSFENFADEVLIDIVGGAGFLEVHNLIVIENVRSHNAVYGRYRQSRVISGRRTYRTGIGVGGKTVVTVLFRTHGRVIAVCSGSNKRNARFLNGIVYIGDVLFVYFAAKTATGA